MVAVKRMKRWAGKHGCHYRLETLNMILMEESNHEGGPESALRGHALRQRITLPPHLVLQNHLYLYSHLFH